MTYDLPTRVLHGWSLDAFVLARSAAPVNVVSAAFNAVVVSLMPRPNFNPGVPLELYGAAYAGGKIFNRAAFHIAPNGQQGSFGRIFRITEPSDCGSAPGSSTL